MRSVDARRPPLLVTFARVYSSRLSGPQAVHLSTGGVTLHSKPPAGHRYVIRYIHMTCFDVTSAGDALLAVKDLSGTFQNVMFWNFSGRRQVIDECFLVLRAGEELHAYAPSPGLSLTLTCGGYDLLEI